jgi:hypothetical protein
MMVDPTYYVYFMFGVQSTAGQYKLLERGTTQPTTQDFRGAKEKQAINRYCTD